MNGHSSSAIAEFRIFSTKELDREVFQRQSQIPGFEQESLSSGVVTLIGAGGLGGEIGEGLVRKGTGKIRIFDSDVVEPSNLNRQMFYEKDIFQNKAKSLAENLSHQGFGSTTLVAYPYSFEEAVALNINLDCSLAIVGVDNDACRVHASVYFRERNTPVLFTGVSEDGNSGYVFVQGKESDSPCFGCLNKSAAEEVKNGTFRHPCPNTPAIKDILKTVAGIVIYAADTLVMPRTREWNYRVIYLDGSVPSGTGRLEKKSDCPLCSTNQGVDDAFDKFRKNSD